MNEWEGGYRSKQMDGRGTNGWVNCCRVEWVDRCMNACEESGWMD